MVGVDVKVSSFSVSDGLMVSAECFSPTLIIDSVLGVHVSIWVVEECDSAYHYVVEP